MRRVLVMLMLVLILTGCKVVTYRIEQTRQLMGTDITITVIHKDQTDGKAGIRRAFEAMEDVQAVMSNYDKNSQVFRLNKIGKVTRPDDQLKFLINESIQYSNRTGGAFDITVQAVLEAYQESYAANRTPTEYQLNRAKALVDYRKISWENGSLSIPHNMSITLGGIAKGYAIDLAVAALKRKGIEKALVNAGGDMRAIGSKQFDEPWTVSLQDPRDDGESITEIELIDMAVATSGDYERYYINKSYHHIIDPRTGRSATDLISVTVVAPTAMEADAVATSVFVMGPVDGLQFIEGLPGVEALLITSEKEIIRSTGFMW